jgi:hypothetical protein
MRNCPRSVGTPAAVFFLSPYPTVATPLPAGELSTANDPGEFFVRIPFTVLLPLEEREQQEFDFL